MRCMFSKMMLEAPNVLLMDEPTNHLDLDALVWLEAWLKKYEGTMLVISHDRQLLDTMERIVELSSLGLRSYGGNYSHYAEQKALEQQNALDQLEHADEDGRRAEFDARFALQSAEIRRLFLLLEEAFKLSKAD